MEHKKAVTICIILLGVLVFYLAGAVNVGRAPILYHLDSAIGTSAFMGIHSVAFSWLDPQEKDPNKKDMFTTVYQDFDKVRKNVSE